ncbi:30S ribosomal protein S6 [Treponema phagedenis]|uniref:Small ribosomal subunit protein bS6 n=1 Tax=Treponema phagedenis TaxID=162 RepID=A0A0B7GR23_TREPH|nr:30S ribosomal protein S6 [Treponema phagedenis]NVP24607.1 30S ribosomal protein S6 [Treponema phagedenis]QEJ94701.1 30S ribosomal protein S6 [Treponema phagedenis]QEJ97637.1 30S ribosomal protein S6 [Treponema phagedenis]QEK00605.1 30S ribosomal protein S6 [Treponema phagedenis]QEK03205.1 30S ribosomal protein S6 [Treponema phagedenis]
MRKYELMTVFPVEEEQFKQGIEALRSVLGSFDVQIESEEPFGDRDLAYEIKKKKKAKYVLFTIQAGPEKILAIDKQFKLNQNLLTYLFIRIDE